MSVQRRIYDQNAKLSRPFGDPQIPERDENLQVRKWSNDNRVEMKVVTWARLGEEELQVFVCVANGAWADRMRKTDSFFHMRSDTLQHNARLLDRTETSGRQIGHSKRVEPDGALTVILRKMRTGLPAYSWPMLLPQPSGKPAP